MAHMIMRFTSPDDAIPSAVLYSMPTHGIAGAGTREQRSPTDDQTVRRVSRIYTARAANAHHIHARCVALSPCWWELGQCLASDWHAERFVYTAGQHGAGMRWNGGTRSRDGLVTWYGPRVPHVHRVVGVVDYAQACRPQCGRGWRHQAGL